MLLPGQALRLIPRTPPHMRRSSLVREPRLLILHLSMLRPQRPRRRRVTTMDTQSIPLLTGSPVRSDSRHPRRRCTPLSDHNMAGHSRSIQTSPARPSGMRHHRRIPRHSQNKQRQSRQRSKQRQSRDKRQRRSNNHSRNRATALSHSRRTFDRCKRRRQPPRRPRLSVGRSPRTHSRRRHLLPGASLRRTQCSKCSHLPKHHRLDSGRYRRDTAESSRPSLPRCRRRLSRRSRHRHRHRTRSSSNPLRDRFGSLRHLQRSQSSRQLPRLARIPKPMPRWWRR